MNLFKVEGGTLRVGPGAALLLTKAQAMPRQHNLDPVAIYGGVAHVRSRAGLEFKAGEMLGLDVVDKSMAHLLVEIPGKGPKDSVERQLGKARDDMDAAAAAAERADAEARTRAEADAKAQDGGAGGAQPDLKV